MKKVGLLLLAVFTCFAFTIQAQTALTGSVKDANGTPIAAATIAVKNTTTGTISNMEGQFELKVESFPVTIIASFVGYDTKEIVVESAQPLNIVLAEGIGLDEVLVTGTMSVRSEQQAAMSMTSMKAKQIQLKAASGQADILRSVPGITAEGGGGEVAANVFVRGLPSGGQYVFNPLEYDGMPVISTFGLNSSAHDVYIRNDFGIKSLDFPRGGAAILYGAGSVAGVINYISKTGRDEPENIVQLEVADKGRVKADFFTSGKVGGEGSKTYYALSGFYRYDEGPIETGLPTEGFQLRGNIKQKFENGEMVVHGQYIDDHVQFFLPLHLDGDNREYATGNNREDVKTFQTVHAANLSYQTPDGVYRTPIRDGVSTQGGYFMSTYKHTFENDLKLNTKLRYAKYAHQFNLFIAGGSNPLALDSFVDALDPNNTGFSATNTGTSTTLNGNDKVIANKLLDRNRPMTDLAAEINLTKKWLTGTTEHNVTLGAFLSRTEAWDQNVQSEYLSEFNNKPELVNLTYYDVNGDPMTVSQNGLYNPGASYSNNFIAANKQAVYLTDEMKMDRLRIDVGIRIETISADITREGSTSYAMNSDSTISSNLQSVKWGNNSYSTGSGEDTDWAGVIAANYELTDALNVYGNITKGYFFPQPRGIKISADGTSSSYETEQIYQGELGLKYRTKKLKASFAGYYVGLNDRMDVNLVEDENTGLIVEIVSTQSTRTIGIEANADYELLKNLNIIGSLTYQDHEYTEFEDIESTDATDETEYVGNKLERQPNLIGYLALEYASETIDAGFSMNYTGEKHPDKANNVTLDPISIFRLDGGYTFKLGENGESLRLGLAIFNLFDSRGITEGNPRDLSQSNSGDYFVGRPILPRRTFVRATFNF